MPESLRTSRRTILVGGAAAAAAAAGWRSGPAQADDLTTAGSAAADNGARVVRENYVGLRMLDLTIDSPSLASTCMVRLLLPPRWSPDSQRTWPALYLLHGAGDDYTSWTRSTDVAALTEGTDVLVVMPTAGRAGFYSDWCNHGAGGPPRWETFHLVELRQILERGYRAGPGRSIAGLSMGGFGAMSYAARHPGMFRAAAAYSGVVHTTYQSDRGTSLIQGTLVKEGYDPMALWGDPRSLNPDIWAAHNPYDLADRLLGIPLYASSGNGIPGPFDPPGTPPDVYIEPLCGEMTGVLVRKLQQLGADITANLYGPGTHSWPYWQRELHRSFPLLMNPLT